MTVETVERSAGRGRQPAEVERDRDLELELRAERAEGRELAETVLESVRFIEGYFDRPAIVMHHAGRLGHTATRFLRQRSPRAHL